MFSKDLVIHFASSEICYFLHNEEKDFLLGSAFLILKEIA